MAFGVTTDNIFSLLDEENEDPQALASKAIAAQEPKAKKEAAAKPKDAGKPAGGLKYQALCLQIHITGNIFYYGAWVLRLSVGAPLTCIFLL